MGLEAQCVARHGKSISEGKVHLDTDRVLFRGAFRLSIPFKDMKAVRAEDGCLSIALEGGSAVFELGAAAEKWAKKILNPPTRLDKLGVKEEMRVVLLGVHDADFQEELKARRTVISTRTKPESDLIFFRAEEEAALKKLPLLLPSLSDAGALWVIYPKGVRVITEAAVFAAGRGAGLVDVKVASFSATHTAHKFVIPVAKRKRGGKL
jgi:hypothetical protein